MTGPDLAQLAGFSAGNVSDWEKSVRVPGYEAVARLAAALRIPTSYLWDHLEPLPIDPAPPRRPGKRRV